MSVRAVLARARELVAAGWTQGYSARAADGDVAVSDCRAAQLFPGATCYCAYGAVAEASHEINKDDWQLVDSALAVLHEAAGGNVVVFNDRPERTQAEVLEVFDRAVEAAQ